MRRRQALFTLVGSAIALAGALQARAQTAGKAVLVGLLDAGDRQEWWAAFRDQMSKLGYAEGRGVAYESRAAAGNLDRLPALAQELVQLNVAVIVTSGTAAALAAKKATGRIPIVMATGVDQVSLGLVESLAHPGGNVTGVSSLMSELTAKRFELLREIFPRLSRLAVLWHPDNVTSSTVVRDLEAVAVKSKVALQNLRVRSAEEISAAFEALTKARSGAVFVIHSPYIYRERRNIAALALKHRVPGMHGAAEYVESGGFVAYAPSYPELFRRAAVYVDKVLKGANAGDLPIEQPTKIDLIVNLKTARLLGIALPPAILARAERVIE